jgi:hypothetical protein
MKPEFFNGLQGGDVRRMDAGALLPHGRAPEQGRSGAGIFSPHKLLAPRTAHFHLTLQ